MKGGEQPVRDEPAHYVVQHVREALAADPRVSELHVEVTVAGDRVFITGAVPSEERRTVIAALVEELLPDHDVSNHVTVEPISGVPDVEKLG
jgi:osmotically-inducible protein OsmY